MPTRLIFLGAKRERAHAFYEQLGYERYGYCFRLDLAPVTS